MIQLANAPCSWGVLEFTQTDRPPLRAPRFLDEVAASGYVGTELGDWGFLPTDPSRLHDELAARGLQMAGAFVPVALADPAAHADGVETAVRIARLMREVFERAGEPTRLRPVIVLSDDNCAVPARCARAGRITPEDGLTTAQWDVFARAADRIAGRVLEATDLRTVFHHHCGGFVETAAEVAALLDRTDPTLVGLCFDTGHLTYGGADVLAARDQTPPSIESGDAPGSQGATSEHIGSYVTEEQRREAGCSAGRMPAAFEHGLLELLKTHIDRVWHVHFKDCSPIIADRARKEGWDYLTAIRHGLFCELGRGSVPFDRVLAALHAADYEGWIVVEQDVLPGMGSPLACARHNREYLRGLGL